MWIWLLAALGSAEIPLPDYDEALAMAEWHRINEQIDATCRFEPRAGGVTCSRPEVLDAVIERGETWQSTVQRDAGLTYLVGLAWRYKGSDAKAKAQWEAAVKLDPDYRAPWYDLGELYLAAGEFDSASKAFEQVARLTPEGAESWLAPWRLAEVAAFQQDVPAFEEHMRTALRFGFTFDRVSALPNWKGFARDPVMGPSVQKLVTVYGSPGDLDALKQP